MKILLFVLATIGLSGAFAAESCPDMRDLIAKKPLRLTDAKAQMRETNKRHAQAAQTYRQIRDNLNSEYAKEVAKAEQQIRECGVDLDCVARVRKDLELKRDYNQKQLSSNEGESRACEQAVTFVAGTIYSAAVVNSIQDLIKFWEARGYVKLVGEIQLMPIENPGIDSEVFNIVHARKSYTEPVIYQFGNVGFWYDLKTASGEVRVAGMAGFGYERYKPTLRWYSNLVLDEDEDEKIPNYEFSLDRLQTLFVKGKGTYWGRRESIYEEGRYFEFERLNWLKN